MNETVRRLAICWVGIRETEAFMFGDGLCEQAVRMA